LADSTALIIALENKHPACAQKILELWNPEEYLIEHKNSYGNNAFFIAIMQGDKITAQRLIEAGANTNIANNLGYTPLAFAIENNNSNMIKMLLETYQLGALETFAPQTPLNDIALLVATSQDDKWSTIELILRNADINITNKDGLTPLRIAIQNNNLTLLKKLLDNSANVNFKSHAGDTPLKDAVSSNNLEIIDLLLLSGAIIEDELIHF
jgi:ankyrin repeat protein